VVRELDRSGEEERADVAVLSQSLRNDLIQKHMTFIDVDRSQFRAALAKTTFYADWKAKYGDVAWGLMESTTGPLA
jgi:TRAP-type C4-dicarboxylate transport system substrate-binding protein